MLIDTVVNQIKLLLRRTDHTRGSAVQCATKVCCFVRYNNGFNYHELEFDHMTPAWKKALVNRRVGDLIETEEEETIKILAIFDTWRNEDLIREAA